MEEGGSFGRSWGIFLIIVAQDGVWRETSMLSVPLTRRISGDND